MNVRADSAVRTADGLDVEAVRARFPILRTQMQGRPLVYLDSAASTQKPDRVIARLTRFY
ncbi:MAG TPA: SufS family cysteine desulfurase, partial [Rhodospirillales bacterium]|nr:SufS family cysteine desulfurase [Rhodospirillales bacterium]